MEKKMKEDISVLDNFKNMKILTKTKNWLVKEFIWRLKLISKFLFIGIVLVFISRKIFSWPGNMWPINMENKDEIAAIFGLTITFGILVVPSILKELFKSKIKIALNFLILIWVVIGAYLTIHEMRNDRLFSKRPFIASARIDTTSTDKYEAKVLYIKNVGNGAAFIRDISWFDDGITSITKSFDEVILNNAEEVKVAVLKPMKEFDNKNSSHIVIQYNDIGDNQSLCYVIRASIIEGDLKIDRTGTPKKCEEDDLSNFIENGFVSN